MPHLYCFSLHLWFMVHFGWAVPVRSGSFLCHLGGYYCQGISLLIIGLDSCIELRLRSQFFICMAAVFFYKKTTARPRPIERPKKVREWQGVWPAFGDRIPMVKFAYLYGCMGAACILRLTSQTGPHSKMPATRPSIYMLP